VFVDFSYLDSNNLPRLWGSLTVKSAAMVPTASRVASDGASDRVPRMSEKPKKVSNEEPKTAATQGKGEAKNEMPPRSKAKLVLKVGEDTKHRDPSLELVHAVLRALVPVADSFVILERGKNYVQTICGLNGFHVEQQEGFAKPKRVDHFKAGRISEEMQEEPLQFGDDYFADEDDEASDLHIPGFSNELLQLDEILSLFSDFWHERPRSSEFVWRLFGDFEETAEKEYSADFAN
jgi:hypothetical protein